MRPTMTMREIKAMFGVTQQRVSQMVQEGALIAEKDRNGAFQFDRASAEALARRRAMKNALSPEEAEQRELEQREARENFRRDREREQARERERQLRLDELYERGVIALESIAVCLRAR